MTDKTTRPEGLSEAEWLAVLDMRKRLVFDNGFNAGLETAALIADSWADQCCGGSGEGGEGYRNLAVSIREKAK